MLFIDKINISIFKENCSLQGVDFLGELSLIQKFKFLIK